MSNTLDSVKIEPSCLDVGFGEVCTPRLACISAANWGNRGEPTGKSGRLADRSDAVCAAPIWIVTSSCLDWH